MTHSLWRHMGSQDTPPRSPLEPRWQNTWGRFLSPCGSPISPRPREVPPPAHLATSATPPLSEVTQRRHGTPSLPLLSPFPLLESLHCVRGDHCASLGNSRTSRNGKPLQHPWQRAEEPSGPTLGQQPQGGRQVLRGAGAGWAASSADGIVCTPLSSWEAGSQTGRPRAEACTSPSASLWGPSRCRRSNVLSVS